MSSVYTFRITRDNIEGIEEVFPNSAWYREGDGEKVKFHYHGLVFTKYKSVNTVKSHLKAKFEDLVGNQSYSCSSPKDLEKYKAYMSKGKHCVYNGTSIDFSQYKWLEKKELKKSKIDRIFEKYDPETNEMVMHCVNWLVENDELVNRTKVTNYCTTFLVKNSTRYRKLFVDQIDNDLRLDINDRTRVREQLNKNLNPPTVYDPEEHGEAPAR